MSNSDNWLLRYEKTQVNLRRPSLYWLAAPMVIVGLTGLLWHLPVPEEFSQISPLLNWGSAFLMATAVYYFIISLSLAIGLLPFLLGLAAIQLWLANAADNAILLCGMLLVLGLAGVALSRPVPPRALFQDLQLMMISPAWLLSLVFKRFRIPI